MITPFIIVRLLYIYLVINSSQWFTDKIQRIQNVTSFFFNNVLDEKSIATDLLKFLKTDKNLHWRPIWVNITIYKPDALMSKNISSWQDQKLCTIIIILNPDTLVPKTDQKLCAIIPTLNPDTLMSKNTRSRKHPKLWGNAATWYSDTLMSKNAVW